MLGLNAFGADLNTNVRVCGYAQVPPGALARAQEIACSSLPAAGVEVTCHQRLASGNTNSALLSGRTVLQAGSVSQVQAANGAWEEAVKAAVELDRQGRYAEAAAIMRTALKGAEQFPRGDARLPGALSVMGAICQGLGSFTESERFYLRALRILDEQPDADPTLHLGVVNNLATLFYDTGRYARLESFLQRYRPIREKLDPDALPNMFFLINLAGVREVRHRYAEAEAAYKEALAIVRKRQNADRALVPILTDLGALYTETKRYAEALDHLERSLSVCRRLFGGDHPETIRVLLNLSTLYAKTGQLAEAERCAKQALASARRRLGPEHRVTGLVLSQYGVVLRRLGRKGEAKELAKQARAIEATAARERSTRHTIDVSELPPVRCKR
jgi:tetratricopeptide (TPR) repeat protein